MTKTKKPAFKYTPEQTAAAHDFNKQVEPLIELAKLAGAQRIEIKLRTGMGSRIEWLWPQGAK